MSEARMSECWVQWKTETGAEDAETFKAAYMAGQNDPAPWQVAAVEREAAARALEEYAARKVTGAYAADLMRARAAEIREAAPVTEEGDKE